MKTEEILARQREEVRKLAHSTAMVSVAMIDLSVRLKTIAAELEHYARLMPDLVESDEERE